ncbi:hypothetical protein EVA_19803 [gut metagenome]|uniref:Uncharacterized protein n=1 Tax=gut metagenome TaxID=749906 RepID=J9BX33_9ZZZZ
MQDGLQGIGLEDVAVIGMNRSESQDGCFHKWCCNKEVMFE